ncbi:hypothetical protein F5141DRAFT_464726 [Pisolithus sp. B1]|nr:hypothetical protein F5141DRAFT_464726 [Pisolithus sp. B1]
MLQVGQLLEVLLTAPVTEGCLLNNMARWSCTLTSAECPGISVVTLEGNVDSGSSGDYYERNAVLVKGSRNSSLLSAAVPPIRGCETEECVALDYSLLLQIINLVDFRPARPSADMLFTPTPFHRHWRHKFVTYGIKVWRVRNHSSVLPVCLVAFRHRLGSLPQGFVNTAARTRNRIVPTLPRDKRPELLYCFPLVTSYASVGNRYRRTCASLEWKRRVTMQRRMDASATKVHALPSSGRQRAPDSFNTVDQARTTRA